MQHKPVNFARLQAGAVKRFLNHFWNLFDGKAVDFFACHRNRRKGAFANSYIVS